MSEKRLYPKCAGEMDELAKHMKAKYGEEDWETQLLRFDDETGRGAVFQVRPKASTWRTVKDWTGLGLAATVTMKAVGAALEVEVGGGKWIEKATIIGVASIVFIPLVVAAGIGAWMQRKLLNEILSEVEDFFRRGATVPKCLECSAENPAGAKFCNACGKAMGQRLPSTT